MKIRLSDIECTPCKKYYHYIIDKYGADGEFDPIEVFDNFRETLWPSDVAWLMDKCEKSRTKKMFEYFMSTDPGYDDLSWVIESCGYARTPEILEKYKDMEPDCDDVRWLICNCEFAQTVEMLEYFKSIDADERSINNLLLNCEFAAKNKHILIPEETK